MRADSPASQTALMVAAYRARATARPDPLISDPHAEALAGEEGAELARALDGAFPHMELWIACRTAYLDGKVTSLTRERGVRQVVLLGAGLDTRAARLVRAGVCFFEVDHPATQAEKRRRVAALAGYPAGAATYVPCDFEREDFLSALAAAGFDPAVPAVIVWEGVTAYLTEAAVRATCRRIASGCARETVLLFDVLRARMATRERLPESDLATLEVVRSVGEPVTFGIDDPLPLLYEEGFRHVRTVTFDEIALTLTGTYDRARKFRFQQIALASHGGQAPARST